MADPDSAGAIYVVDASSWISIEGHPAQNRILYFLSKLIEAGRVKCPPEVWDELERCDWVLAWVRSHRKAIVKSVTAPEYWLRVGEVHMRFPAMCGTRGSKDKGDGYVVALASYQNATSNPRKWVAVATETVTRRPSRKIPTACDAYGVECVDLVEMLRREFPDESW